jgi:GNAT superfamily N-acetyltransferase
MPDLLVKLYELPPSFDFIRRMAKQGVTIRKPIGPERHLITDWIRRHFNARWASEFDASMSGPTPNSFVAIEGEKLLGFACHDATARGFFGPTGVLEGHRGKGIGKALLLACLQEMRLMGYGYAIIGGAGPVAFYEKCCGAAVIPGSKPGIYAGMLKYGKNARRRPASARGRRPKASRRMRPM